MPRVSRQQTELNRVAITETAARLYRERGLNGVSVAEVMNEAGLTHGGFYGHFESKEALATEACAHAFEQSAIAWKEKIASHRKKRKARKAIVDHYLASSKRDTAADTCPVVAFSGDMSHEDKQSALHQTYIKGLGVLMDAYLSTVEPGASPQDETARRQAALVEYSLMVGAMTLARATGKTALSDEILKSARTFLNSDISAVESLSEVKGVE
ncbi:TetR/AcrR family transcriptional regulator [Pseudomonas sp. NPDC088368]|jgi:TetR/AcrR family transcriptional repressor of nem operon|uniref:TetR/AcrR family transcriptional regulator n=1 Tax=Pseudomonas sp. NPDC088368 TaxID=3364453 RepID=UPI0037F43D98